MATCRECMHNKVCFKQGIMQKITPKGFYLECDYFKSKSDYVKRERGEWVDRGNGDWSCTNCNEIFTLDIDMHPIHDCGLKFCPNCGSDMRKENDNG